jgi:hypothetical protein
LIGKARRLSFWAFRLCLKEIDQLPTIHLQLVAPAMTKWKLTEMKIIKDAIAMIKHPGDS